MTPVHPSISHLLWLASSRAKANASLCSSSKFQRMMQFPFIDFYSYGSLNIRLRGTQLPQGTLTRVPRAKNQPHCRTHPYIEGATHGLPSVRIYLATAQTYQERCSCHSRVLQAVSSRPHRH